MDKTSLINSHFNLLKTERSTNTLSLQASLVTVRSTLKELLQLDEDVVTELVDTKQFAPNVIDMTVWHQRIKEKADELRATEKELTYLLTANKSVTSP